MFRASAASPTGASTQTMLPTAGTTPPTGSRCASLSAIAALTSSAAAISAPSCSDLTATPNAGSTFIGWTVDGALAGLENPLTITMGSAHTVAASLRETFALPLPARETA